VKICCQAWWLVSVWNYPLGPLHRCCWRSLCKLSLLSEKRQIWASFCSTLIQTVHGSPFFWFGWIFVCFHQVNLMMEIGNIRTCHKNNFFMQFLNIFPWLLLNCDWQVKFALLLCSVNNHAYFFGYACILLSDIRLHL
jgi:hypothetical protein